MAAITTHSSGALWWKATGKGRFGVFAVWKLCDPHLSTSVSYYGALYKCLSFYTAIGHNLRDSSEQISG